MQHFVYPSAVLPGTFTAENIGADRVPADLRETSINMVKMVRKHYGKQHMLSKLVVDYEACIEASTKVHLCQPKKSLVRASKFPRGTNHHTLHSTQHNTQAGANAHVYLYDNIPNVVAHGVHGGHGLHDTAGLSAGDKGNTATVDVSAADKNSGAAQHGAQHNGGANMGMENAKGVPAPHTIDGINDSPVKYRYR